MYDPNYIMTDANERTFVEIVDRVEKIKESYPNRPIWRMIEIEPLTTKSIDLLIHEGWEIELNTIDSNCISYQLIKEGSDRIIGLRNGLDYYTRDEELFHELCHAWYNNYDRFQGKINVFHEELDDGLSGIHRHDDRTITEWLARSLRANPQLLKHTIYSFNLEPKIYDFSSYMAFSPNPVDLNTQLALPFRIKDFEKLKITQMENISEK